MAGEKGRTTSSTTNSYEESRKQRLLLNKQRFQDLGISDITTSLSNLTSPGKIAKSTPKKTPPQNAAAESFEPRRSSRARNPVPSYADNDAFDLDLQLSRKRSRFKSSSWTSYVARPLEEVKMAQYEDRLSALREAEEFQASLQSGNPSFVKSMVRSHVYSCFWLGLPTQFCKDHLPKTDADITLVDENGVEYDAKYLAKRTGLSGGWRGFALDHKLDDGDAVVYELVEPQRLKVYTFRVSSLASCEKPSSDIPGKLETADDKYSSKGDKKLDFRKKKSKSKKTKVDKSDGLNGDQNAEAENRAPDIAGPDDVNLPENDSLISQKDVKKAESVDSNGMEEGKVEAENKLGKRNLKARKKPAPRLFRKKA
ncbi:hypothetical protein K2173_016490 [Erythroxylum novogranatense]|uniref:TF-B3 domain-containing protein n=1 Tax=Erythroxylum novogranatense TaxID=1862640 RepID=A0AAV8SH38_9ROSI|nr:hypothetical protein K2173_016490 [Erythroxylum novogranatense]